MSAFPCLNCSGTGYCIEMPCPECNGKGEIEDE